MTLESLGKAKALDAEKDRLYQLAESHVYYIKRYFEDYGITLSDKSTELLQKVFDNINAENAEKIAEIDKQIEAL